MKKKNSTDKNKTKKTELESKLKILEKSLSCDKNIEEYRKCMG